MVDTDAGQSDMSGPTVKVNEWHHIAGVYDGSEIRLYVDGELAISKPRAGKMGTKSNLYIGIEEAGGKPVSHLVGRLDEICISNIARTAAEIKSSMSGFSQVTNSGNSSTTWGLIKRF